MTSLGPDIEMRAGKVPADEINSNSTDIEGVYHSLPDIAVARSEDKASQDSPMVEQQFGNGYQDFYSSFGTIVSDSTLVQACYVSIFAILGTLLRIVLAQLFGEECANPGTVGWLKTGSPLCVTKSGATSREGGIIFADLPANLLGSFIMGFLQDGNTLGLPVNMAIPWLTTGNAFQAMTILHLGMKTGFCGSLTTFSSWNSEMVVMMFGTGDANLSTQFIRALFGYLIGVETALGSFAFGKTVSTWLHKYANPLLADEGVAVEQRAAEGVHINRELPEFERRYLPDLSMDDLGHVYSISQLESLEKWRESTRAARRVGHRHLPTLIEIEMATLVNKSPVSPESESIARSNSWDLDSLREWTQHKANDTPQLSASGYFESIPFKTNSLFTPLVVGTALASMIVALILGLILFHNPTAYSITDRTSCYAMLFAPFGAMTRWQLGKLNGQCTIFNLNWLPLGTLAANVLGSIVSISMLAVEYRIGGFNGFWAVGTLRAARVGFSGCLSTVSTFVAEISNFNANRQKDRAYFYILISLVLAGSVSSVFYAVIVYS